MDVDQVSQLTFKLELLGLDFLDNRPLCIGVEIGWSILDLSLVLRGLQL